jgi:hypothetical protein
MSQPGGYIRYGDEWYSFSYAICLEDEYGSTLSIEAEGEQCLFLLPNLIWQARSGLIEDLSFTRWPYDMDWPVPEIERLDRHGFVEIPDQEPLDECVLWVPCRLMELAKVLVVFGEVDVERMQVEVMIRVIGMSEAGDLCQEFDLWLWCEYVAHVENGAEDPEAMPDQR